MVTAGYLLASAGLEALRWFTRRRALGVVALNLLADGVYLAWLALATGGLSSPLRFLPIVHLIAVALLASYRTGIKVAAWHSLLFVGALYAQASGLLDLQLPPEALPGGKGFATLWVSRVGTYMLIAVATSWFSYVNERELRRRKRELEALARMASALDVETDPASIASILARGVCETFELKRAAVLGAPSLSEPTLLAYSGPGDPRDPGGALGGVVRRAWRAREPMLAHKLDPQEDRRIVSILPFARNVVVAPLFAEGQPIGVLVAECPRQTIERRAVTMIGQFGSHAALALRNAWLLEKVQRLADTDPLTGVANRRSFAAALSRELSRATRSREAVSLIMLDVDHFKKYNDRYGHQAGDRVLVEIANCLQQESRTFDTVARYGGEEFSLILPSCSVVEARSAAERLVSSVRKLECEEPITVSAGVATFPMHASNGRAMIRAADEALYSSKHNGRNQVTVYRHDLDGITPVPLTLQNEAETAL
jgi:two-component system, cell cycle response regulator